MGNNKLQVCNNWIKIHLLKYFTTPIPIPNHPKIMPVHIKMMKIIKNNSLATIKMLLED